MKKFIPAGIISIFFVILLIGCGGQSRVINYYLYTAFNNAGVCSVSSFKIEDSTGMLTPIVQTPVTLSCEAVSMIADHAGNRVYVAQSSCSNMLINSIDPYTGVLSLRATSETGGYTPQSLAIDPSDRFIYSANYSNMNISFFRANETLSAIATPLPIADNPDSITFNPLSNCCYITKTNSNTLLIVKYSLNTGEVYDTWESSATIGGLNRPTYIVVHPTGQFIYVANDITAGNSISVFKLSGDSNRIEPLTQVTTAYTKLLLAMDPAGRYLYAADKNGTKLTIYNISSGTGELTQLNELDMLSMPRSIVTTPNGKYVYVSNYGNNSISMFKVTNDAAILTPIGTYLSTTGYPGVMTIAWKLQ